MTTDPWKEPPSTSLCSKWPQGTSELTQVIELTLNELERRCPFQMCDEMSFKVCMEIVSSRIYRHLVWGFPKGKEGAASRLLGRRSQEILAKKGESETGKRRKPKSIRCQAASILGIRSSVPLGHPEQLQSMPQNSPKGRGSWDVDSPNPCPLMVEGCHQWLGNPQIKCCRCSREAGFGNYSSPPLAAVLLPVVSVTRRQPRSANIKRKIPLINNSEVFNCMPFWTYHDETSLCPALFTWDVNNPSAQRIPCKGLESRRYSLALF